MMKHSKKKRPPREGFRRRINPWYGGMNKRQIAWDVMKSAVRWLVVTILSFFYWTAILLLFSIILIQIWHVTIGKLLLYAGVLCMITSLVYVYVLVYRKLYY